MAENNEIQVSIIVPVYNSAPFLRTCIDSLLCQTVESYEIICVNNGSTDESGEILQEYAKLYPEKVFVYNIEHSNYVGTGRNYGLSKARGKYIYLCDSDDIVEKNGVFFLYNRMQHYDLDVCYGQVNFVNTQSGANFTLKSDGERNVSTSELIKSGAEFWRRMFKKSLLDKVGPMPEDTSFDDIAYLPVVHSYSKKAMSTTRTIYNYFRRSRSTVGSSSPEVIESTVRSEKYAIEHCNPKYIDDVLYFVAKRIVGNLSSRWVFADKLASEIYELMPKFRECDEIKKDNSLYEKLNENCISDFEMIPRRAFLSNFDGNLTEEKINKIKETAFDTCEVVVLDQSCFDSDTPDSVSEAYNKGDYDFVSGYCALKSIYEQGGIYIDRRIIINKPLNYLRLNKAFFSFIDNDTYSDWIFGGVGENEAIGDILKSYSNKKYKNDFLPLPKRMKNILTVVHKIPLTGCTCTNDEKVTAYSPDILVCNLHKDSEFASLVQICTHDFSALPSEETTSVKYSTLALLSDNTRGNTPVIAAHSNAEEIALLREENKEVKRRVADIESSGAYKLALKLSAMGNKVKPIKRIAKKLIK